MRYAVILAGGSGTRLWPLSRRSRPKQLLRLFQGASLLHAARERISAVFPPEQTFVVTSADYVDLVAEELPDVPRENLLGEPCGRDTANAIGLAAHLLALRDPGGTMAVFTADHMITPRHVFEDALRAGLHAAESNPEALVTFGIRPDSPHTGYGYIHRGRQLAPGAFEVRAFKEKPPLEVAQEYVRSGEYFWNSGMFCWKLSAILGELQRSLPENNALLADTAREWEAIRGSADLARRFNALRGISIDYGVMERAGRVITVEMNCCWRDLGSWSAMAAIREGDEAGNVLIAPKALAIGGGDNILVSEDDHLIITLGLSDVIVVHSEDVTLVCHRRNEQRVRELSRLCRERFGEQYE